VVFAVRLGEWRPPVVDPKGESRTPSEDGRPRPVSRVPFRGVLTTTGRCGIMGKISEKSNVYVDFFIEHAAGRVRAQGGRFRPKVVIAFRNEADSHSVDENTLLMHVAPIPDIPLLLKCRANRCSRKRNSTRP
jgi:hypothetical protein